MIYYFVHPYGEFIDEEAQPKGWFEKKYNPCMFTSKREAIADQKRRLKARIAELQEILEGLE